MTPMTKTKYEQAYDGVWFRPRKTGFREQCCDCGLVHDVDYRTTEDGGIEFKARVNRRATAAVRRAFKFNAGAE
jgi:hypothetical protein